MNVEAVTCPNCGARLTPSAGQAVIERCQFCGAEVKVGSGPTAGALPPLHVEVPQSTYAEYAYGEHPLKPELAAAFEGLWRDAIESWEDPKVHVALVEWASSHDALSRMSNRYAAILSGNSDPRVWKRARRIFDAWGMIVDARIGVSSANDGLGNPVMVMVAWIVFGGIATAIVHSKASARGALVSASAFVVLAVPVYFAQKAFAVFRLKRRQAVLEAATRKLLEAASRPKD